jgi:tRNA(adenine34) deaminase
MEKHQSYMEQALEEARQAAELGEVPVGAIIVHKGEIIARAHNRVEIENDSCQHAEMIAIRNASKHLGNWRLGGCEMYVTLEPCPMCAGAILLSRIEKVYFGASDPRIGAVGSAFDLSHLGGMPHKFEVIRGLLIEECTEVLKEFFASQRKAV